VVLCGLGRCYVLRVKQFAVCTVTVMCEVLLVTLVSVTRDVRKFKFEFDNVRTSNVFNRFEIRRKRFVVECEFVEKSLF